jgi:hypothetical protein
MVGTRLTIVISSDSAEYWSGNLLVEGTDRDYGDIFARGYSDVTRDYEGSRLEAAGAWATVHRSVSFDATTVDLYSDGDGFPGDWFVLDYNAIDLGSCAVSLYEIPGIGSRDFDPFNPPPAPPDDLIYQLVFSHVPTRDFDSDAKVDFADFAVLASFWKATNCADLNWCEGADLDTDGDVDYDDLMLFADYWLEATE